MNKVQIEGVTLHLAHPDELAVRWVGQQEVMRQLLAAWMVVDAQDTPMNPRLLGKPGVGRLGFPRLRVACEQNDCESSCQALHCAPPAGTICLSLL